MHPCEALRQAHRGAFSYCGRTTRWQGAMWILREISYAERRLDPIPSGGGPPGRPGPPSPPQRSRWLRRRSPHHRVAGPKMPHTVLPQHIDRCQW